MVRPGSPAPLRGISGMEGALWTEHAHLDSTHCYRLAAHEASPSIRELGRRIAGARQLVRPGSPASPDHCGSAAVNVEAVAGDYRATNQPGFTTIRMMIAITMIARTMPTTRLRVLSAVNSAVAAPLASYSAIWRFSVGE